MGLEVDGWCVPMCPWCMPQLRLARPGKAADLSPDSAARRLVNLPSVHTRALCHTSVHTDTKDTTQHTSLQCHTHLYNATHIFRMPHKCRHCHTTSSALLRTLAEGPQTVGWAPSAPIFTQCALVHACLTKHTCLECICHTNVLISKVAWKFFKYLIVDLNKEKEANNHVQEN